jgi:hypothetical protein
MAEDNVVLARHVMKAVSFRAFRDPEQALEAVALRE